MSSISDKVAKSKAAIYIRVSTHWQVDKDSLQVQRRELTAYSDMVLGIPEYEIFEDPGYSAKNTDRPAYQQMMDRLRTGEFSHLLVWKIDRISRNLIDFANMYAELKSLGVTFVSKNEQFDTSSAIGEAMLKIILVFAELERKMTAERVTAVMLSRANNGQWNGGRIPYGYDYNKESKEFSINESEKKVYDRILDLYEDSQSLLHVARTLNESGTYPRSGSEWSPTGIHKILTNIFYEGHYRYNVHQEGESWQKKDASEWITIEDHHPALIDDVRFDRIQFLLKRNRRGGVKSGDTYVRKNVHIFGGLLRCGKCGSNMTATLDKRRADGWRPSIYGCAKRRKSTTACDNKYINDAAIGPFVFNYLSNILSVRNSMKSISSPDKLRVFLLSGPEFADVKSMEPNGVEALYQILLSGKTGMEYKPSEVFSESSNEAESERNTLNDRRRKDETALNRLKSLYLYGDESLPEKDYIVERQKIVDDMNQIDARLAELAKDSASGAASDSQFLEKASYFLMIEQMLKQKHVDYEKYVRSVDPNIPRSFLHSVIDNIEITDGLVTSITFKNGLTNRFIYAE